MQIKSILTTALLCFPEKKTFTLAGFEPWSSVLQADAMAIAPRRKSYWGKFLPFGQFHHKKFAQHDILNSGLSLGNRNISL
jgi:hypothetical protein